MNWAILTAVITREVVAEVRTSIESELQSRGFTPNKHRTAFVRRNGTAIERVELTISEVSSTKAWASLSFELKDRSIAKIAPGWLAGGRGLPAFPEDHGRTWNIARAKNAKAFVAYVRSGFAWFELAADARRVLEEASRRYVPGFVEPSVIVPYLRVRLGVESVAGYARAFLAARPELWPAVIGRPIVKPGFAIDHGTELAQVVKDHAPRVALRAPRDCVRSRDIAAANLRCFFGRELRAWGEPEAAALLRRIADKPIVELYNALEDSSLHGGDAKSARALLELVGANRRRLRRTRPTPRLFQYHVLNEPFA